MEVEIIEGKSEGKNKKSEDKKKECVFGIKSLARDLDGVQENGYRILALDDLSDKEKDQLIDIMASAKGAKKIVDEMLAEKSDVDKGIYEKIDKKADEFLSGLGVEDKE